MFNHNISIIIRDDTHKALWFKNYKPKGFAITKIAQLAQDSFHRSLIYKELSEEKKRCKFKMEVNFDFEIKGDAELPLKGGRRRIHERKDSSIY